MKGGALGTRGPELAVAALLMVLAVLVIGDSLRVGTGWADDGPRSGYFPFYIGCGLLAASGWTLVRAWLRRDGAAVFAEREQLAQVFAVLAPTVVYVAAIFAVGIYVASALLIGYFMRRFGRYRWLPVLLVSMAVPLVFYAVFERWFLVPLPKGWLGWFG